MEQIVCVEEGDHEQRQGPQAQGGVYVGPQIGMNPKLVWGLPNLEF
jgi:hypothetical protein